MSLTIISITVIYNIQTARGLPNNLGCLRLQVQEDPICIKLLVK